MGSSETWIACVGSGYRHNMRRMVLLFSVVFGGNMAPATSPLAPTPWKADTTTTPNISSL